MAKRKKPLMVECPCCQHQFDANNPVVPKERERILNAQIKEGWAELLEKWGKMAVKYNLPKTRENNEKVRAMFRTRWVMAKEGFWADFRDACIVIANRPFYQGVNDTGWVASLEYLLRPGKIEALAETYRAHLRQETRQLETKGETHDHTRRPEGPGKIGGGGRRSGVGAEKA